MNLNDRQASLLQALAVGLGMGLGMGLGLGVTWQLFSGQASAPPSADPIPRVRAALPAAGGAVTPAPQEAALAPSTTAELAPTLDRLAELLEAHLELARSRRAPVTTTLASAGSTRIDGAEVVELTNAIWALSRSLDNQVDPRALSVPPRGTPLMPNRAELFGSGAAVAAMEVPHELAFEQYITDFSGRHYGWTTEEVAGVYGRPDYVEVLEGESQWYYEVALEHEASEDYTFCFSGNVVFSVNVDAYP
ncbi:MAG: hypothetical protein ACYTFV_17100 [Planctomycetota bacterium]|jgi:hypothetical protein